MNTGKADEERWYDLINEDATLTLGGWLAGQLTWPAVVFLHGPLGAGKTSLVRALLRELGYTGLVKSPTYTLVEEYPLSPLQLIHFDLYRLSDPEELEFMGVRDYFAAQALCLLEWPEKGDGFLPPPQLEIQLEVAGNSRKVKLTAHSPLMAKAVASIEQQLAQGFA